MDEIKITTTSDTPEQVRAALGLPAETTPPVVETPAVETPAIETPAEPEAAVVPNEPKADEKPAPKVEAKPKADADDKKSRFQDRIDELTREKHTSLSERDAAKAETDRLKAELETLKALTKPATETKPVEPVAVAKEKPKEDDFPIFSDFVEALSEWKADQKAIELRAEFDKAQKDRQKAIDAEKQTIEMAERKKAFDAKVAKVKETHPDYDEVIAKSANVNVGPVVRGYIQSEDCVAPAEILLYFASNPSEADRVAALAPPAQVRELIRLELKHEAGTLFPEKTADTPPETPVAVAPKKTVPVSSAPAPVARVGQGATTPAKDPNTMSHQEYKAWRAAGGGR